MHAVPAQFVEMLICHCHCAAFDAVNLVVEFMVLIKNLAKVIVADFQIVNLCGQFWEFVKDVVLLHNCFQHFDSTNLVGKSPVKND